MRIVASRITECRVLRGQKFVREPVLKIAIASALIMVTF